MSDLGPVNWNEEARLGILRSLTHFRRLLRQRLLIDEDSGAPDGVVLSGDDAAGLCDLLDHLEERYQQMNDLVVKVAGLPDLEALWRNIVG